jgi:hypothetical protein
MAQDTYQDDRAMKPSPKYFAPPEAAETGTIHVLELPETPAMAVAKLEPNACSSALRRQRLERLAGLDENRLVAGRGLKAPHDHIDVEQIELNAAADATGAGVEPEPRNGWTTMSPQWVRSRRGPTPATCTTTRSS